MLVYLIHADRLTVDNTNLSVPLHVASDTWPVFEEIWTPVGAGIVAGLGVAMPLGAVGALLLREGLANGFRVAAGAAAGVAAVDVVYCAIAMLTGVSLADTIDDHLGACLLVSGLLIVMIGLRQLRQGVLHVPPAAPEVTRGSASKAFGRFVGLTAVNPITLIYFVALSGAVTTAGGSLTGSASFAVAVGASSLAWQLILAAVGSWVGASVSSGVGKAVSVIASALIVTLGAVLLAHGVTAFKG